MGKGSSGTRRVAASKKPEARSRFPKQSQKQEMQEEQRKKKEPARSGAAVQLDYIDYVKKQTNVDLSKARDTEFDTRRYFNIDTRDISRNDLATVRRLAQQYPGDFEVSFESNGAHRLAIFVKRRKR